MTIEIHDACEPLRDLDIVPVERQLGSSLPADYKRFLLTHNGGYPEPDAFTIEGYPSGGDALVHYFMCVKDDDIYNLIDWVEAYSGRLPPNLLPVACDTLGNLICLSISGEDLGRVYFWDHEEEAGTGETPSYDNVYPIANSFQEFLNGLHNLDND